MKKGRILALVLVFSILASLIFVSAYKQNSAIDIKISTNQTPCRITIQAPNSTNLIFNQSMTSQTGTGYANYTLSATNSSSTGVYNYFAECNSYIYSGLFSITTTGEDLGTSQALTILGLLGFTFLLFGIARGQQINSWKLRLFFDTFSILFGIITLNSIRVVATQSSNLYTMSWVGLIVGIIIVAFMIAYAFILYTIEVVNYFKKKRDMRWETNLNRY